MILMTCSGSDGGGGPTEPEEPTYIVNLVSLGGEHKKVHLTMGQSLILQN